VNGISSHKSVGKLLPQSSGHYLAYCCIAIPQRQCFVYWDIK